MWADIPHAGNMPQCPPLRHGPAHWGPRASTAPGTLSRLWKPRTQAARLQDAHARPLDTPHPRKSAGASWRQRGGVTWGQPCCVLRAACWPWAVRQRVGGCLLMLLGLRAVWRPEAGAACCPGARRAPRAALPPLPTSWPHLLRGPRSHPPSQAASRRSLLGGGVLGAGLD